MVLPHETFAALAGCIRGDGPASERFVAACVARLQPLPPDKRDRLALAVRVLGSRVAVLIAIGQPRRFAALSAADRTRCFAAYGQSALPPLRSAYEAVRRLVLAVHYADPDVAASIGYDGPMHTRLPRVPWEGALTGTARDDE